LKLSQPGLGKKGEGKSSSPMVPKEAIQLQLHGTSRPRKNRPPSGRRERDEPRPDDKKGSRSLQVRQREKKKKKQEMLPFQKIPGIVASRLRRGGGAHEEEEGSRPTPYEEKKGKLKLLSKKGGGARV